MGDLREGSRVATRSFYLGGVSRSDRLSFFVYIYETGRILAG
jgi:hypothetical protein